MFVYVPWIGGRVMTVVTHIIAFSAGATFGMFAMVVCVAAGRKDDE